MGRRSVDPRPGVSNSNTQRANILKLRPSRGPDIFNIYWGKKEDLLYFFIYKHELRFNLGLLNLGQAALSLSLLVIAYFKIK